MSACACTGHRVLGKNFSAEALERAMRALIGKGADTFLCGMAMGFDALCCETALRLKREYPLKVVACVPCGDQSSRYPAREKNRYEKLLAACDERVVLHETYVEGCMFERNRYMVDRCDILLAYLESERGGTYYTVNYAKKRGKTVIFL